MKSAAAGLFDRVGARQGHFQLESGYHGELWLDLDTLFAEPPRLAVSELAELLRPHRVAVICGPLTGGAFLAQLLATELNLEFAYTAPSTTLAEGDLYQTRYRLPRGLAGRVHGRRVAVVDDVISAGSSTRATLLELRACGAQVAVAAAFLILGSAGADFFAAQGVALEFLAHRPYRLWRPEECPSCAAEVPLEVMT